MVVHKIVNIVNVEIYFETFAMQSSLVGLNVENLKALHIENTFDQTNNLSRKVYKIIKKYISPFTDMFNSQESLSYGWLCVFFPSEKVDHCALCIVLSLYKLHRSWYAPCACF